MNTTISIAASNVVIFSAVGFCNADLSWKNSHNVNPQKIKKIGLELNLSNF